MSRVDDIVSEADSMPEQAAERVSHAAHAVSEADYEAAARQNEARRAGDIVSEADNMPEQAAERAVSPQERALEVSPQERAELDALQEWVAARLMRPEALSRDPLTVARAQVEITGNAHLSPVAQLEIYREQFWLRHTGALLEDYPALSAILGQAHWERLTEDYLREHPPQSFTLRELGRGLPEHVARCDWLPERALAEDMARLEWAYVELFDAAPLTAVSHEALAAIPESAWPSARLGVEPSLQFISARYPVAALRAALLSDPGRASTALPEPSEEHLVLYRHGLELHREPATALSLELLKRLRRGEPLGAAAEALASTSAAAQAALEANVGAWFQRWAALGFFVSVT